MARDRIDRWCQAVLPAEFGKMKALLPRVQSFLEANLPEPVNREVTLLTINREEIVIAASSPLVSNFLRLHSQEIQQQLRETFALEQPLRFRSLPDSLLRLQTGAATPQPQAVSEDAVAALERSAQWVEDEDLKAALLSLADSLKAD